MVNCKSVFLIMILSIMFSACGGGGGGSNDELSSSKDITGFTILGIPGTIGTNTITLTVPYGTNLTALSPTITITGTSVYPSSEVTHDFSSSVIYRVTAEDSSTKDYTVTVTQAAASDKDITSFSILGIQGNIGTNTINLTVPYGTNPTSLIPTIVINGIGINPSSGEVQDFSTPVTYTVTAADSSIKGYTVTVTVAEDDSKDITAFTILGILGTIGTDTVNLTVPYGTDVTSLIPTISISGASINPSSGIPQDFSSPVIYEVTAADSSTKEYTVYVTVASDDSKNITSFSIMGVSGTIGTNTIDLILPYGTDTTSLTPTIIITGVSVNPDSGIHQNFSSPVTYTVTAADASTKNYLVTVNVRSDFVYSANYTSNDISSYSIDALTGLLTPIGSPVAAGTQPSSMAVHPDGEYIYVTNSGSNNIYTYSVNSLTGALTTIGSPISSGSYPTSVIVEPTGNFAYVTNNASNTISAYSINSGTGVLSAIGEIASGTQPRSITVDPTGNYAYVANYTSNDVSAYTIDSLTGLLTLIGSPVSAGTRPFSVAVAPNGSFAYVVNASSGNISTYSINPLSGTLTPVGSPVAAGTTPLCVSIDPNGNFAYVANEDSHNISAYSINALTGVLTPVAGSPFSAGTSPISISVDPTGNFAYVANQNSNNIIAYSINSTTGVLTTIGNFAAGTRPVSTVSTRPW